MAGHKPGILVPHCFERPPWLLEEMGRALRAARPAQNLAGVPPPPDPKRDLATARAARIPVQDGMYMRIHAVERLP